MPGNLEAIIALQKSLSALISAEERLATIPDWMSELHEEHGRQKVAIEVAQATSEAATQARRKAEAELNDVQEKLKRYQEQLSGVSTQREYGALLKEIDTAKGQIKTLEQQVLESIDRFDEAQKALAEHSEGFRDLDARYSDELAKWEAEKPTIAKQAAALKKEVEALRGRISRGSLVLFERLYERAGGIALAQVSRIEGPRGTNVLWHCEACSFSVRPQVLVEIRTGGKLIQCESCKRILYLPKEAEET
jgi:uncharacterized protein